MNQICGNIRVKMESKFDLKDFEIVENSSKSWTKVIYFYGETELKTSEEFLKYLKENSLEILDFDISISSEDKIFINEFELWDWLYELVSFEWEQVNFDEIRERFEDSEEVISIREWEVSKKFWNRIIKADFVY